MCEQEDLKDGFEVKSALIQALIPMGLEKDWLNFYDQLKMRVESD